jgi:hypothetical protein
VRAYGLGRWKIIAWIRSYLFADIMTMTGEIGHIMKTSRKTIVLRIERGIGYEINSIFISSPFNLSRITRTKPYREGIK